MTQNVVRTSYVKVKKFSHVFVVVALYPGFRLLLCCTQVFVSDVDVYILKVFDPKIVVRIVMSTVKKI